MKINDILTGAKNNPYVGASAVETDAKTKSQGAPEAEPVATDKVRLSERSREIARAQDLAVNAPEVRSDKVEALRAQVAAGTYNVKASLVADKMLRTSISEKI